MLIELHTIEDRKKAFKIMWKKILKDLLKGRIPTYHVLHFYKHGSVGNHYMTPISLEPVNKEGDRMVWINDFEFFLRLFLRLKRVTTVEYDEKRPAVIFYYEEWLK
ncbi:MAG: hypothetical protein DRO23_13065 [Thermoprotei archaeon]|nr:MAG: hypothetical protein DRO23_13065 [Thermoprotei archaeon]